ncbi:MAG: hypothetical protein ACYC9W_07885 [Candidatus Limnocylindria bacterium]
MAATASDLVVMAWSYPRSGGHAKPRSRWHVVRTRGRSRQALCGAFPRAGALLHRCRTDDAARRAAGAICLRCARWLADRSARPDRGVVLLFPSGAVAGRPRRA